MVVWKRILEVEQRYLQSFHIFQNAVIRFNALDEMIDFKTVFSD